MKGETRERNALCMSPVTNTNIMELRLSDFGIIFEKRKLGILRPVTIIFVGVFLLRSVEYIDTIYFLYDCALPYCKSSK